MAELTSFKCPKDSHTSLTLAVNDMFYVYFKVGYNTNAFEDCSTFEMRIYDEDKVLKHTINKFVLADNINIVGMYIDDTVTSEVFSGYYTLIGSGSVGSDTVRYSFANMEIFNVK
jgi:hypothetical protein